jgi:transposase
MGGTKGQKKRRWSDDEKRSICEQTLTPGISVAQVARRYSPLIDTAYRLPGSG